MIRRLEIEAENEYWLSRPYLTRQEEYNHNKDVRMARWVAFKAMKSSKFPEHRYMSDHLNHLNVSKKWTSWAAARLYLCCWEMQYCTPCGCSVMQCNKGRWEIRLLRCTKSYIKVILQNSVCFFFATLEDCPSSSLRVLHKTVWVAAAVMTWTRFVASLFWKAGMQWLYWKRIICTDQMAFTCPFALKGATSVFVY